MQLDELLPARTVEHGAMMIQPIARLTGWSQEEEAGGGGLFRIAPVSITVQRGEETETIPITDPTQETVQTLVKVGVMVSGVSILLMLLAKLLTRR